MALGTDIGIEVFKSMETTHKTAKELKFAARCSYARQKKHAVESRI